MSSESSSPEPDNAGKSPGRARLGAVPSYAVMGLLKENMQAVLGRKPTDSKAPSERETSPADDQSPSMKLSNLRADPQQRTGASRENALLRAELEVLHQQNQDLVSRLHAAESKMGRTHSQNLLHEPSQLQQQGISNLQGSQGTTCANSAQQQLAALQKVLAGVLLQPAEVEAAALTCSRLARYWELAHHYGLYPEVAASNAAYWRAQAAPPDAIFQSVQQVSRLLQQQQQHGQQLDTGPDWLRQGEGRFVLSTQATAVDLVEVERGARQLQELGVEAAVMAVLAEQAAARRGTLQLLAASPESQTASVMPVSLSPEEVTELQLQMAHLAHLWGRAALQGAEPQIATCRAQQWCSRLNQQPSMRNFQDVQYGWQELRMLGVEQQLWQTRHRLASNNSSSSATVASIWTGMTSPLTGNGLSSQAAGSSHSNITAPPIVLSTPGSLAENVLSDQKLLLLPPAVIDPGAASCRALGSGNVIGSLAGSGHTRANAPSAANTVPVEIQLEPATGAGTLIKAGTLAG